MVYYLGYYKSNRIDDFSRSSSNAALFKMGYVLRLLRRINEPVTILSWCPSDRYGLVPLREIEVDALQKEVYLPSFRIKKMPMTITAWHRNRAIYKYLVENVKKDDTLVVYHAMSIGPAVLKAKRKNNFKLVLEVEEIYHEDKTLKKPEKIRAQETSLIEIADAYIVVNDLIYGKYINNGKPHGVLYGVYDRQEFEIDGNQESKEQKQLLFSGSIDKVRGAELAVDVAKYLTKDYCLHISGAGASGYVKELCDRIEKHNASNEGCEIVFHGQLSEAELDALALSCDIGLNLQDIHNPFEAVSFPSKITFYFQHGLNVVSTKMSSVLASSLAEFVQFGDDSAEEMAKQIMCATLRDKETNMRIMKDLDQKAEESMSDLIK